MILNLNLKLNFFSDNLDIWDDCFQTSFHICLLGSSELVKCFHGPDNSRHVRVPCSLHWGLAKFWSIMEKQLGSRNCNKCYLCMCVSICVWPQAQDRKMDNGWQGGNTCFWGQGKVFLQHARLCVSMCIQPCSWSENTDCCVPGSTALMQTGMS